jgi:hypothetical protein
MRPSAPGAGLGPKTARWLTTAFFLPAVALAIAGCLLHIFMGHSWGTTSGHARGCDDAFISYRYARNAAEGRGLVYNPGERVEGYSNLLYVALLVPAAMAGSGAAIYPAALALNTAALAALVLLLGLWLWRRAGTEAAVAATLGIALFPPLWAAVASGMETPLVLLLQSLIIITTLSLAADPDGRAGRWLQAAAVLSVLMRPDGFIFPLLSALVLFACGIRRSALRLLAAVVFMVAALTAWRLAYYGLPLPMTYYAKVTGSFGQRLQAGIGQLRLIALPTGMLPHLLVLALLALALAFALHQRLAGGSANKSAWGPFAILAFFGGGWLAYWLYIGGDIFMERFLLVVAVISWLAMGLALRRRRTAWLLLATALALQLAPLAFDGRFAYRAKGYDLWVTLGEFLGERYPGVTLAIDAAGKVPFYSRLRTIDMLGLNDAHIGRRRSDFTSAGHSKIDPEYVLGRRPDLIAAWLAPSQDMAWGIVRELYLARGYRLRYLVQSGRFRSRQPIIDLLAHPVTVGKMYSAGYTYGVLERAGASNRKGRD